MHCRSPHCHYDIIVGHPKFLFYCIRQMPDLCSVLQWPLFNRHLLGVQSSMQSCSNSMCNFWMGWGDGQSTMTSQTDANTWFKAFFVKSISWLNSIFDFLKYASPTQCSTCIVKCTFRKCNAPFPSATVMSQLGMQSRPVHILTFFDFVMALQCFWSRFLYWSQN